MFAAKDSLLTRPSAVAGYQISRSLRFNAADNAYLSRTPASSSSKTTWTFSTWVKRSALDNFQTILSAGQSGSSVYLVALFFANNNLDLAVYGSGGAQEGRVTSTAVFRDMSAWYHVMAVLDTTNATSTNRLKLYINGSQITTLSVASYPPQNSIYAVNSTDPHFMGTYSYGTTLNKIDGYQTETYLIDGQALTPSSFGETNAQTGVWQPKAYSGSYGTNGFYLNFSDNSNTTAATLGKDYSGNGNNWTPNNFSVTAGAGNDSLVDVPTAYGIDTGAGGTVRGNYATMNPLSIGSDVILRNGNLEVFNVGVTNCASYATIGMSSGKWYCEWTAGSDTMVGISSSLNPNINYIGINSTSWGYYNNGNKYNNNVSTAYGASYTSGNIVGIAFDADAGTLVFYKNGASQGTAYSSLTSGPYFFATGNATTTTQSVNFGQRPFAYTAPSGFKALCTQNLPTPTIGATSNTLATQYFTPTTYTGNGSASRAITNGINMASNGGLVWSKQRSGVESNFLIDNVRGNTKYLMSNSVAAEATISTLVTSFDSTGYSIGNDSGINANGSTYVSWVWGAGGSGSTNTAGSITSTVSANTTSGFSVVTWTGSSAGQTVGHGLGVAPSLIIAKTRNNAGENWPVYHKDLGVGNYLYLSTTAAANSTYPTYWGSSAPSSTVFGTFTGGYPSANNYGDMVAYCFAEVAGYSKFGSYEGNGSTDGPFVYTGFRPAYLLAKSSSNIGSWVIYDAVRNTYNVVGRALYADLSDAEYDTPPRVDFLSNGFKLRSTGEPNNSGRTFIYMAFAENPFKYSLAR